MTRKIITWLDADGRYRITSPAYGDLKHPDETEDECIARVVAKLKTYYELADDHVFHEVEDADQQAKLIELSGLYFRYGGIQDSTGARDGRDGAWEMDTDGTPRVNMAKARGVQMDKIRVQRNAELVKKDLEALLAIEAGNTSDQTRIAAEKVTLRQIPQTFDLTTDPDTPEQLQAKWPDGLPRLNDDNTPRE